MDTTEVIRKIVAYKDEMMRKQAENACREQVKTAAALVLRVYAENTRRKQEKTAAGIASFLKALPSLSGKAFGKAHDVVRPKRFVVDKARPNYEHNLPGFHTKQTVDLNGKETPRIKKPTASAVIYSHDAYPADVFHENTHVMQANPDYYPDLEDTHPAIQKWMLEQNADTEASRLLPAYQKYRNPKPSVRQRLANGFESMNQSSNGVYYADSYVPMEPNEEGHIAQSEADRKQLIRISQGLDPITRKWNPNSTGLTRNAAKSMLESGVVSHYKPTVSDKLSQLVAKTNAVGGSFMRAFDIPTVRDYTTAVTKLKGAPLRQYQSLSKIKILP